MRLYAESAPSDERRAYTEIIDDLSNAVSSPSIERRAYTDTISAEFTQRRKERTNTEMAPKPAPSAELTPKS
jgi:hypothetical protein